MATIHYSYPKSRYSIVLITIASFLLLIVTRVNANPKINREQDFSSVNWKKALSVGFSENELNKLDNSIKTKFNNIHSLLVSKGGKLVIENYYLPTVRDNAAIVHSVTKSVTSILIGIAIDKKLIKSLDVKVADFFPELKGDDSRKNEITLRHLLTMTAGFVWDDRSEMFWEWYFSSDFIKHTWNRELRSDPGEVFTYNSGVSHVLSGILTRASGMSTLDFAKKYLFQPLGIKEVKWISTPEGYNQGGGGLYLSAIDLIKIGQLYLNNGVWDRQTIVSKEWVQLSTKEHVKADSDYGYGFQWWIRDVNGCKSYRAWGRGGQFIVVIPDLDMVMVVTSKTAIPLAPTFHYSAIFDHIAESLKPNPCTVKKEAGTAPEQSIELPTGQVCSQDKTIPSEIADFIENYSQAFMRNDLEAAMSFYSRNFLLNGRDYDGTKRFLSALFRRGSTNHFCVKLRRFEQKGNIARIEGTTHYNSSSGPLVVPGLIYEAGQWKWYGNLRNQESHDMVIPKTVLQFLDDFSNALVQQNLKIIPEFYSDSFSSRGFTKKSFLKYIYPRYKDVMEYKIELTSFLQKGNSAEISGLVHSNPWGTAPLRFKQIVLEDGQWKWMGD